MKGIIAGGLFLAGTCSTAFALDCTGGGTSPDVTPSGRTVCASSLGGDRWQEYHEAGTGKLFEWAQGTNPIDHTREVGSWSRTRINNVTKVTYNYGTGGSYTFEVWLNGGQYYFCEEASPTIAATVDAFFLGQGACP